MTIKRFCLAAALALATSHAAFAQPTPIGSQFLVGGSTVKSDIGHQIAPLQNNGGFVVVWSYIENICFHTDCFVGFIRARLFDVNGSARGAEFQVADHTYRLHDSPSLAGLGDGGFVVVWESQARDSSGFGIFGQRFDASGTPFGSEFRVNTQVAYDQVSPNVTALSNGGFVVLWASDHVTQTAYQDYAQIYDGNGARVGGEFQLSHNPVRATNCGNVTGVVGGGFVATWMEIGENADKFVGQRYNSSGKLLGKPFTIDTQAFCLPSQSGIGAKVAALKAGGFVAAWPRWQDTRLPAQRYTTTGLPNGSRIMVAGNGQSPDVSVAAMADGGFLVTWTRQGLMYGRRYTATGVAAGDTFEVKPTQDPVYNNEYGVPRAAGLPNGNFVVLWQSSRISDCLGPDDCPTDIYGQLYSP